MFKLVTIVTYENNLDLDDDTETLGISSRSKLFDTQTTFSPTLSTEALKQTRNSADDNLFGGLGVNSNLNSYYKLSFSTQAINNKKTSDI